MQQNNQWTIVRPGDDGVKPHLIHGDKQRFRLHSQPCERAPGHLIYVAGQSQSLSLTLPNRPYRRGGRCAGSKAK